ncbi:coiled-coil domain-containing protein 33 [Misgurnus anguillicaudatus]|uniref:coiled-coil domain-containing protein 33 n=1 Tax=Misgurnus anguillicaudatus TaxID=75329 RepID=UPI003CCF1491
MDNVNTANPDQDLEAKSHTSSPPSSPQSKSLPPRDIPDLFLSHTHVTESPLTREDHAHSFAQEGHVSRPGAETLSVILHGAADLPPLSDGGVPLPFAIMRSHADVACDWRSHAVTRCPPHPTHNPSWEETIRVELRDTKWETHRKDVTLTVADGRTKELLAHFRLPVPYLHPFHHYHLELVQSPRDPESSGTRLYVTMVRKLSLLPRQPCFYFTGFEVLLQSVNKPFRIPVGSLIAVARIVADFNLHRSNVLLRDPRATGVSVRSVWFPDPSEYAFKVPTLTAHGWPQVSLPRSPEDQPVWNHSFLFLGRDCATVFTEGAALVLEFYPTAAKVMNMGSWHIQGPLAFSGLILDHSLYRKLSERGLRVPHLPLQIPAVNKGCPSFTTSETPPTISLVIRLIGSERPDSFLTDVDCSVLPCLDFEHPNAETSCPRDNQPLETHPETAPPNPEDHTLLPLEKDLYDLPSHDAISSILSEYLHINNKPKAAIKTESTRQEKTNPLLNRTFDVHPLHNILPVPDLQNDQQATEVTEHQTKELENYRTAMHKMADDIIVLRSQVSSLETENSQLRRDFSLHQDLGRTLLDDTDVDVMTKTEIADRIASLKFKLASESSRAAVQNDRIQQLQNELIRKNDVEKEFIQLQRAHQQQQAVLKKYEARVSKIAALEDTIRQQDKVIDKMEKLLDTKLKKRNKENSEKKKSMKHKEEEHKMREIEAVLVTENSRLREELDRLRNQPPPAIIQQPVQSHQPLSDSEKLELLTQLARAEGRIQTLEQQLKEISKQWGKEKQEMLTRLSEYEHGFARTSTMIFHDLPVKSVTDSVLGRVRHGQLDPLK